MPCISVIADGAENKEEEQTKIRSKIDELLAKIQHTEEMECLDDGQTLCRKGETAELRQVNLTKLSKKLEWKITLYTYKYFLLSNSPVLDS